MLALPSGFTGYHWLSIGTILVSIQPCIDPHSRCFRVTLLNMLD